ncbi:MAG: NADH-quinone oxidoreductase subunit M [Anaerolineales bacterium]|nr:NADH-quinone oxidoreductase subunit M [Anaerolineales bacterium]
MTFPILSVITFTPLVAGLLILMLPAERKNEARVTALAAAAFTTALALFAYFSFDPNGPRFQFVEGPYQWVPQLGITYHMAADGLGLPMILLTALVLLTGVMISWNVEDRTREFMAFFLFLSVGVFGVFAAQDLFLFFFLLEIAVFPKYLMIVMWGWPKTREYGAMKLTLYLFIASVVALIGVLWLYALSPVKTFNLLWLEEAMRAGGFDRTLNLFGANVPAQHVWFPLIFFGFAIMGAIFPLHSWAPDGHVAAPTAISMMLAGVEMKVGMYAAFRVGITLLPEGAAFWSPVIVLFGLINVVYAAYIALIQRDFKYIIGFSSVSHMGLVMMGFATLSREGFIGAGLQMFSHGIMTAIFFAIVGMVYDRAHTRNIPELGGLAQKMPWAATGFIIGGFTSMGMPGFSGFVAEIPIYMGLWKASTPEGAIFATAPWYFQLMAIIAVISIVVTAAYILRAVQRVFFGELPAKFAHEVGDVSVLDKIAIAILSGWMILLGVYPVIMYPMVTAGITPTLRLFVP